MLIARKKTIAAVVLVIFSFSWQSAQAGWFSHQFWVHIFSPVRISKLDDLQFGKIAPDFTTPGTVTVNPNSDNDSVCGAPLTCMEGGDRARFRVTGRFLQLVNLSVSNSITLDNGLGDTMIADNFTTDASYSGGWFAQLVGAGAIDVGVGADLHVGANQPVGTYTGTFIVTASYQ